MLRKKSNHLVVLFLFFLLGGFTAGCAGQPPASATPDSRQPINAERGLENGQIKAGIDINHVEVHRGERIIFSGKTSLSTGACIESQLFEDGVPVSWWPSDVCFLITSEEWEFAVLLGEDDGSGKLDDSAQYQLQVWWADAPEETVDEIYFDLAGPQSP